MRSVPEAFYQSAAWKHCRDTYLQLHPLCEDCLLAGKYVPAEHVHHLIWLNENNYTDPEISLNHKNLRALCIAHHNKIHYSTRAPKRWAVDENGHVTPLSDAKL